MVTDGPRQERLRYLNAPYLRGMLLIACIAGIKALSILKGGQLGLSAMTRWFLGYWAHNQPDPVGLTLPDKVKGAKIVRLRVIPFFKATRVLREMMSGRSTDAP